MSHPPDYFDARAASWDADPVKRARALAVADGIRNQVPISARMHALEYGCGTGLLSFALQPQLESISLWDSSEGMLAVLKQRIAEHGIANMHPRHIDLVTDPLPLESYDLIYSSMTFHHVQDINQLLSDLHSLLRSPGHLCVADLDAEDGSFHGPGFDGHQGFDRRALASQAAAAGFRDIRFTTVFTMNKGGVSAGSNSREYPLFLMVAGK